MTKAKKLRGWLNKLIFGKVRQVRRNQTPVPLDEFLGDVEKALAGDEFRYIQHTGKSKEDEERYGNSYVRPGERWVQRGENWVKTVDKDEDKKDNTYCCCTEPLLGIKPGVGVKCRLCNKLVFTETGETFEGCSVGELLRIIEKMTTTEKQDKNE
jgi:hypothetical protein